VVAIAVASQKQACAWNGYGQSSEQKTTPLNQSSDQQYTILMKKATRKW
jgi:hypothetical protein